MSHAARLPLSELLQEFAEPSEDCVIEGLRCRSDEVLSGESFAACRGLRRQGL